ncbi:MAG: peptidylprolyl isomerase [Candidatus Obscuribacterales bacterium]|nr:peptidylprolyl isomerase [Candidatus Obscuribacterales bacterium]
MTEESLLNEEDDDLIAKIGDRDIVSSDIVDCLLATKNWQVIDDCLDQLLIEAKCDQYQIQTTDEEVSTYMTSFRQKNQLLSVEDTRAWLDKHHLDDDDFLQLCQFDVRVDKLKNKLFQDKVDEAFTYKKQALQTLELYKIVVANEEAAREIVSSVLEGSSFFEYARKYSIDKENAKSCGYAGYVKLKDLPPNVQDLLIKGQVGEVLGPLKVNKNFEIYLIESVQVPSLDDNCRKQIVDDLFAEWLADTKTRSNIELFI